MTISKTLQDAFNDQITAELHSAQLYLAMSAYCAEKSFKGFSRWLRVQEQEESAHGHKLLDYLLDRGGRVELGAMAACPSEFGSILDVFKAALKHEQTITARIGALYEKAVAEKDVAAQIFLQWFVNEQVEEEANAQEIVDKLTMIGDKSSAALYLDKEYGKRGK